MPVDVIAKWLKAGRSARIAGFEFVENAFELDGLGSRSSECGVPVNAG